MAKIITQGYDFFHFLRAFSYFFFIWENFNTLTNISGFYSEFESMHSMLGKKSTDPDEYQLIIQNLQLLHLVLVSSTVWFSNRQTKYPRYAHNWSELYTEKSMNVFRDSRFVRSTDKYYLVWFYFKYDCSILDTLERKNLNTTTSVAMPAQTHPSLFLVSWSLKLEKLKPIN